MSLVLNDLKAYLDNFPFEIGLTLMFYPLALSDEELGSSWKTSIHKQIPFCFFKEVSATCSFAEKYLYIQVLYLFYQEKPTTPLL